MRRVGRLLTDDALLVREVVVDGAELPLTPAALVHVVVVCRQRTQLETVHFRLSEKYVYNRGKLYLGREGHSAPHLNRTIYILAAQSTDLWKHYAAQTILVAIISGNTKLEESYTNLHFSSILL